MAQKFWCRDMDFGWSNYGQMRWNCHIYTTDSSVCALDSVTLDNGQPTRCSKCKGPCSTRQSLREQHRAVARL